MRRKQRTSRARRSTGNAGDPAHAPGKRGMGPPPVETHGPHGVPAARMHDQPWVPTGGFVGRARRAGRRG